MKYFSLFTLVFSLSAQAQSFNSFVAGLKSDLHFTNGSRAIVLASKVRLTDFGPLARILSPDATATYNSRLNVISLHKDLLSKNSSGWVIKDAREIRGAQFMTVPLQTIFHEMGHAELDTMVENKLESEDVMLMNHYDQSLKGFYKKNFPSMSAFDLFHEHFAYYRSDLIDLMYAEQDRIFLMNGFNKYKKSCYLNGYLKTALKNGISREEFTQFLSFTPQPTPFYRTLVQPQYVYVKGKDFDLKSARFNPEVVARTHDLFWAYHQAFYNFAINEKDYLNRLNKFSSHRRALAECRGRHWDEYR